MNEQNSGSINETLNRLIARYLETEQAGESLSREEILRWHSELADELRSFFANHDQMKGANDVPIAAVDAPTISPSPPEVDDPTIPPREPPSEAATIPPTAPAGSEAATIPPAPTPTEEATIPPKGAFDAHQNRSGERVRYFGDYELLEEIARGGMGVVYKARQVKLNRLVALKMILAGQLAGEEDVKRFHAEAEAAANLDHPGITPIYEIGEHDGQHYFSMAFVQGESLAAKVADGPLPPDEAVKLTQEISEAMAYAHENGVIHRDLKPANVLLDKNGQPKVTDFGLAKKLEGESHLTSTGQILGTPSYMPPEQAASETDKIGPLSDVYSLGAILYCFLTGRPPFQAASPMDTLLQVLEKEPVPPRELNGEVPRDLETICLKSLEKSPSRRYSSAAALSEELERYQRGEPIVARPVGTAGRAVRWAKRNPAVAGLLALVLIVLLAGMVISTTFGVAAREQAERADKKTDEALQQLTRAEWLLYANQINSARREWEIGDPALAWRHLRSTREDFRHWEHDYLYNLFSKRQRTFRGHESTVVSVAFSPDGKRIVSGSGDKDRTIKLWDVENGEEIRTLEGHQGAVACVAFSPGGKRIISGSTDKTIILWDAQSGEEIQTLIGHAERVTSVAFSPDGTRVVSGVGGKYRGTGEIKLWDTQSGEELHTFESRYHVSDQKIAFSPNGKQIASIGRLEKASLDEAIILWDADTHQEILTLEGHKGPVACLAFSPDGKWLASGTNKTVSLWDAKIGRKILTLIGHSDSVRSVAFSPDGKRVATAGFDKNIKVWDAKNGEEILTLKGHTGSVTNVVYSPDGNRIASGGADHTIKLWDIRDSQKNSTLKLKERVTGVAFSTDGKRIAIATIGNDPVKLWDVRSDREILTLQNSGLVDNVVFSPDGNRIAGALKKRRYEIQMWDAATGREITAFGGHSDYIRSIAYSPNGERIATGSMDKTIRLWDAHSREEIFTLKRHKGPVQRIVFSRDGKRIMSVSDDQTLRLSNAQSGQELLSLTVPSGGIKRSVAFSPDGKWIAIGTSDKTLLLWDARTGKYKRSLKGHTSVVYSVAFSPDGKQIASASGDRTIKLWDTQSGGEVHNFAGHDGPVYSLAFSRDGKQIASGSMDKTIKLWDAQNGEEILTLKGHTRLIESVAVSPNGKQIASVSRDKTIRMWDIQTRRQIFMLTSHFGYLSNISFSPDGKRIVGGGGIKRGDAEIQLWDAHTGEEIRTFRGHVGANLIFSHDGKRIASYGRLGRKVNSEIQVWNAQSGEKTIRLQTHRRGVSSVVFSPDGKQIASASPDKTIKLWDTHTGKEILTLEGHTVPVNSVAFSPDGKRIVSGGGNFVGSSSDNEIKLWNVQNGEEILTLDGHSRGVESVAFSP